MSRSLHAAVLLLLLAPTAGRAADPLAELGWLVGDWTADLAPPKGDPLTVNVSYSWAIHRKSFDYAIVFKTKDGEVAQYAGHFYWHPGAKEIRMLQIDRGGQVTEATLTAAGDGKWTQKNRLTRADGSTQEQRAELTRLGDDTFLFRAFVPKGDEWVEGLKVQYRRVKTPPKK